MYHNCIYCAAGLGENEALERFPVGRSVAFDGERGRLWAVCPACARWNLAPLEERWEAMEDAERLFRGTRLRAQRENVGVAQLPDGTRLVRIGSAPVAERAAWRYGGALMRRRAVSRLPLLAAGAGALAAAALPVIAPVALPAAGLLGVRGVLVEVQRYRRAGRVAHFLPAEASPAGRDLYLTWRDLARVRTGVDEAGGLRLDLVPPDDPLAPPDGRMTVAGGEARAVLGKALLGINHGGASKDVLDRGLAMIGEAGGVDAFVTAVAADGWSLGRTDVAHGEPFPTFSALARRLSGRPASRPFVEPPLKQLNMLPTRAVALEMALHEETERRALEGELPALQEMWRQAEEIAAIADRLPDDVA
jgi:hypothetical protein